MTRVFSGIQPTGEIHLGNYLGALRNWKKMQHECDAVYCIVDLHALTVPQDPKELHDATLRMAQLLLAIGIEPEKATMFVQSHVREHTECGWIMETTVSFGELRRMTQFKDKSERADFISAGLFTYPALQAADILLHDTDEVPVGDDQKQHIEITRDIAERFNSRYGDTFVLPTPVIPKIGARVMDLQKPDSKMSKSAESPQGLVKLLEPLKSIERKFKRAVTDTDGEVRFDPANKPGVSNLLSIMAAVTDRDPHEIAKAYTQYGALKSDVAEAVVEAIRPIQERYGELANDPVETARLLRLGADKAREVAARTIARAKQNLGLLEG